MDRAEFKALLEPLVFALRADFDLPTWTVYFRALEDVPAGLLAAAVERAAKSCTFMPKPGELRTFAEEARLALRAATKFECFCGNCTALGFIEREIDGVKRMARGPCWQAHQDRLGSVGTEPLALPAGHGDGEAA